MTVANSGQKNIFIVLQEEVALLGPQASCQFLRKETAASLDLEGSLTVYPVVSRTLLAKMALGISDCFASEFFSRCMETGSRVVIFLSGCEKFSGKEPAAYRTQILSYYRLLASYGVVFETTKESLKKEEGLAEEKHVIEQPRKETGLIKSLWGRIITAHDLAAICPCNLVKIEKTSIITALGQEFAARNNIAIKKVLESR